ncbi:MAG: hypothetical protein ACPGC9_01640 [Cytophagales bacterium]
MRTPVQIEAKDHKSVVINAIVPQLVTYGGFRKEDFYVEKAMGLLNSTHRS